MPERSSHAPDLGGPLRVQPAYDGKTSLYVPPLGDNDCRFAADLWSARRDLSFALLTDPWIVLRKEKDVTSGATLNIATGIAAAIALVPAAHASNVGTLIYRCSSEDLNVEGNSSKVHVTFAGHGYDLQRRRSSIGVKYLSPTAALILDGASAIFVAKDHLDVGPCVKAVPLASAR